MINLHLTMATFSSSSSGGGGGVTIPGLPSVPDSPYLGVALKVAVAATIHPVEYAKTLIQIGYEPLAPTHTKTLITGRPALALPSIFR
jgi:hypothetical protein